MMLDIYSDWPPVLRDFSLVNPSNDIPDHLTDIARPGEIVMQEKEVRDMGRKRLRR